MPLQAFLALFLVLYLRKRLRTLATSEEWYRRLTFGFYIIIALIIAGSVFKHLYVTKWLWHVVLLLLIGIIYKNPLFGFARMVLLAVAPVTFIFLLSDILQSFFEALYVSLETYLHFGIAIAITWMIALLILSQRQRKAALKEQARRAQEEAKNKVIAARKEELEQLVVERTTALRQQKEELEKAFTELQATQTQLIHREKMASLGELTAGIAHEIQNPLNFINNFSEVNVELLYELTQETQNVPDTSKQTILHIINDLRQNEEKILTHGKRADGIVKSMLQHSRSNSDEKEPVDINALVDEYLQLAYHTFRAKDKLFYTKIKTHYDENSDKIDVVPQEIGRVLLNLFNNAFYAVYTKKKLVGDNYEPWLMVRTEKQSDKIEITVKDNGMGISKSVQDKIFQPFFTTKPTGEGTGLGLSLSYDIVKAHGGELKVESEEGDGAAFVIALPL